MLIRNHSCIDPRCTSNVFSFHSGHLSATINSCCDNHENCRYTTGPSSWDQPSLRKVSNRRILHWLESTRRTVRRLVRVNCCLQLGDYIIMQSKPVHIEDCWRSAEGGQVRSGRRISTGGRPSPFSVIYRCEFIIWLRVLCVVMSSNVD